MRFRAIRMPSPGSTQPAPDNARRFKDGKVVPRELYFLSRATSGHETERRRCRQRTEPAPCDRPAGTLLGASRGSLGLGAQTALRGDGRQVLSQRGGGLGPALDSSLLGEEPLA